MMDIDERMNIYTYGLEITIRSHGAGAGARIF